MDTHYDVMRRKVRNLRIVAILTVLLLGWSGWSNYNLRALAAGQAAFIHDCLFNVPYVLPNGTKVTCRITYTDPKAL